ncbi:MAG: hypothetical protein H6697_09855 [Myxococcales bacterium]|nr:hypothetical protein [Myxococcales bacterium]
MPHRMDTSQHEAIAAEREETTDPVVKVARTGRDAVKAWVAKVAAWAAYGGAMMLCGALLQAGAIKGDVAQNAARNDRQDKDAATERVERITGDAGERAERIATNTRHDAAIAAVTQDMWVMRVSLARIEDRLSLTPTPGLMPTGPQPEVSP